MPEGHNPVFAVLVFVEIITSKEFKKVNIAKADMI
jgi:hypothetical protein